jgi:peptidoglycan-N-acetylglucosamine deacetylase
MAQAYTAPSATADPAYRFATAGKTPGRTPEPLKRHPAIALTFDDLPAAGGLPAGDTRTGIASRLAAVLKAHHLKGTYGFVMGGDLVGDPDAQEALRVWTRAGMYLGNHTWSHPSLDSVSAAAYEHDIALDEPALRQYSPRNNWHWFRYPYLEEGNTLDKRDQVLDWLHAHGYRVAQVTLTFQDDDWSDPYNRCIARHDQAGVSWLMQSYLQNAAEFIRLGREEELIAFGHEIPNVLLLHETAFTTLMLPRLLDLLRQQGFRFARLSRVERNRAYSFDPGAATDGPLTNQFLNARHLQYPPFEPEPEKRLNSICQ